jgi:hypothetical protein
MKLVVYEGRDGKLHRTILRDSDPEELAEEGIPLDPPNISDILEEAKTELHNELVRKDLFDVGALNRNDGSLSAAVNKCITRKIIKRYLRDESIRNKE